MQIAQITVKPYLGWWFTVFLMGKGGRKGILGKHEGNWSRDVHYVCSSASDISMWRLRQAFKTYVLHVSPWSWWVNNENVWLRGRVRILGSKMFKKLCWALQKHQDCPTNHAPKLRILSTSLRKVEYGSMLSTQSSYFNGSALISAELSPVRHLVNDSTHELLSPCSASLRIWVHKVTAHINMAFMH